MIGKVDAINRSSPSATDHQVSKMLDEANALAKQLDERYPDTADAMLVLVSALTCLLVSLDDENVSKGLYEIRTYLNAAERFRLPVRH